MKVVLAIVALNAVFDQTHSFLFAKPPTTQRLNTYNVDPNTISVSGFSSGGFMAMNFHVIYSSHLIGAGVLAGGTYGGVQHVFSAASSEQSANVHESKGEIDPTSNLHNDKVFIYRGNRDIVVPQAYENSVVSFYKHYIPASNIKTVFNIPANHGFPTDHYGGTCGSLNPPDYINNCGYNGAYETLKHIYGDSIQKPSAGTTASGQLIAIDQSEFFHVNGLDYHALDKYGYVYIPSGCSSKQTRCRLHVALHGCLQGEYFIKDHYAKHAGYNEVGELNNIIIIYPQATTSLTDLPGCWDFWGYTGTKHATNQGPQPRMIKKMIERVIGSSW